MPTTTETTTETTATAPAPTLHCWADGPAEADGCGTTCMLPAEHDGLHEYTRDDTIVITFAAETGPEARP